MNVFEIITGVFLLLACILIVITTMLQKPKQGGLGSSFASTESYFGKNSGRTMDAVLARLTKIGGVIFVVLTMLTAILAVHLQ